MVRAVVRNSDTILAPMAYGLAGHDDVILTVDVERGVLLRESTYLDGAPVSVGELSLVAFDERFDDEVFRFVSPDGEPARAYAETGRRSWRSWPT
jgi:outer membrane lipoprotein-sorting protein